MRAQYVYENVRFERGRDPRSKLGIGSREHAAQRYSKMVDDAQYSRFQTVFGNDFGNLIHKYGIKKSYGWANFGLYFPALTSEQLSEVLLLMDKWERRLYGKNESVNFERGKDPKDAIGVGVAPTAKPTDITLILEEIYSAAKPIYKVSHLVDRLGDAVLVYWAWEEFPNTKREFKEFRNYLKGKLGPFIRSIRVEDHGDGPFYTVKIKKEYEDLFNYGFELTRFPHKPWLA